MRSKVFGVGQAAAEQIRPGSKVCFLTDKSRARNENPIYVFRKKELRGRSPNFHICVCERFPGSVHIFSYS
jgi:hypothetical protein